MGEGVIWDGTVECPHIEVVDATIAVNEVLCRSLTQAEEREAIPWGDPYAD
jgi:hypothetical protein